MASRTVLLQGKPGAGKSMMGATTALRKPVYVIDVDRKMSGSAWARPRISAGLLHVWELAETFDEEGLKARIAQLTKNEKLSKIPKGWTSFHDHFMGLPRNEVAMKCGTWFVDSATYLAEHFKTHIMHLAGRNKYQFDQWAAYLSGWRDTISVMRDIAIENDKDLILSVHERDREVAGDRTTGVKYENVVVGTEIVRQRQLQGIMDLEIQASIEGQFGKEMAAAFQEVYWLYVDASDSDTKMPEWKCRVVPDGKRALRTSFNVKQPVFKPDFAEIWK